MKDDIKFEEKFNYLLKEAANKFNIKNMDPIKSEDLFKIEDSFKLIENRKEKQCKKEIEELSSYSSNFSSLEKLNNAYAEKGLQKEFDQAKINLEECFKPINDFSRNFKEHIEIIENLISGSFDLCLNNIKKNIKNGKANEQIARHEIDLCYKHFDMSKQTSSKLIDTYVNSIKNKY